LGTSSSFSYEGAEGGWSRCPLLSTGDLHDLLGACCHGMSHCRQRDSCHMDSRLSTLA